MIGNKSYTEAASLSARTSGRRALHAALKPYQAPMRYMNYLEEDALDPAQVAYGPNLAKLRELKKKYDPNNFFRQNVNIVPA